MGLDSYIFKTTKQQAMTKRKEILIAINKDRSAGVSAGNGFVIFPGFSYSENIHKLKPDIYWRKYNHISAWLSEKVFNNPKDNIKKQIGVITKNDLSELKDDCEKVIKHCITPDGQINLDEEYCKNIFPCIKGSFMGSASYDELFVKDIKNAMDDIDRLLSSSKNPNVRFILLMDY